MEPQTGASTSALQEADLVLLKVSASSDAQALASAIANQLYAGRRVKIRAIGAGAVNQMVKGAAIARGYVAQRGMDLCLRPGFETVDGNDGKVSAVILVVIGN